MCNFFSVAAEGVVALEGQTLRTNGDIQPVNLGTPSLLPQEFAINPAGNLYGIIPGAAAVIIYAFVGGGFTGDGFAGDGAFFSFRAIPDPSSDFPLTCTIQLGFLSCSRSGPDGMTVGPTELYRTCQDSSNSVDYLSLSNDLQGACSSSGARNAFVVNLLTSNARMGLCALQGVPA